MSKSDEQKPARAFKLYDVPGVKRPLRLSAEHALALGAKEVGARVETKTKAAVANGGASVTSSES